jgi:hypothetical protein
MVRCNHLLSTNNMRIVKGDKKRVGVAACRDVPRILTGVMHPLPPPPPDLDLDPDPHQDFELDPDPAPHQNNADPQPWAQLSKDCCLIYNYVKVNTKEIKRLFFIYNDTRQKIIKSQVNKLAFFSCCPLTYFFL